MICLLQNVYEMWPILQRGALKGHILFKRWMPPQVKVWMQHKAFLTTSFPGQAWLSGFMFSRQDEWILIAVFVQVIWLGHMLTDALTQDGWNGHIGRDSVGRQWLHGQWKRCHPYHPKSSVRYSLLMARVPGCTAIYPSFPKCQDLPNVCSVAWNPNILELIRWKSIKEVFVWSYSGHFLPRFTVQTKLGG